MKTIVRVQKPHQPSSEDNLLKTFHSSFAIIVMELSNQYAGWMEYGTSPDDIIITLDGREYLVSASELFSALAGFKQATETAQNNYIARQQAIHRIAATTEQNVRGGFKPL